MIAFGENLEFVKRRVYMTKEDQEKTRLSYKQSYTQLQYTYQSAYGILNDLVKGRGHTIVKTQAYQGVSPMVITAVKLSKVDPRSYFQLVERDWWNNIWKDPLSDENWSRRSNYVLAEIGCDIEKQLEYQQLEKIKDLFKCPRDLRGKYDPTEEWWLKYDPEEFKARHPERHRMSMCKRGQIVRPCSFTSIEETELTTWYRECLAIAAGDTQLIKQMVESHCKDIYRTYAVVQSKLSKLGLWVKLYPKTRRKINYEHIHWD